MLPAYNQWLVYMVKIKASVCKFNLIIIIVLSGFCLKTLLAEKLCPSVHIFAL